MKIEINNDTGLLLLPDFPYIVMHLIGQRFVIKRTLVPRMELGSSNFIFCNTIVIM